jgi:voltage-gated potassium channel
VPPWRAVAFERFSAASEMPLLALAVLMVPLLIVQFAFIHHLNSGQRQLLQAADYFIWAFFLVEYLIRFVLAPERLRFVRRNIPDLVVVAVPMLRPLRLIRSARALRLLRLVRLSAFAGEGMKKSQRTLRSKSANYVIFVTVLLIVVTATVVLDLERSAHGANIKNFPDALWWAVATVTSVGYGDRFPVTGAGRAVAMLLMFSGVALFGVIAASIASFFVEQGMEHEIAGQMAAISAQLGEISQRLDQFEQLLGGAENTSPSGDG